MRQYNLARTAGTAFVISSDPSVEEKDLMKVIDSPFAKTSQRTMLDVGDDRRGRRIAELIKRATTAYSVDAIIRQAVDRYAESFKDFKLEGDEKVVRYLEGRLNTISLRTGEHWKTLITRIVDEFFKVGNCLILKVRGNAISGVRRPLYKEKPFALSGLFIVAAERCEPGVDKEQRFSGWKLRGSKEIPPLTTDSPFRLDSEQALITLGPNTKDIFKNGMDVVHISYKKGAETGGWGVGLTLPVIEDVTLLRQLEMSVAILVKKYTNPLIHHKILRTTNPTYGAQNEINEATRLHQRTSPDGVIITGPYHEIKAVGAESQALRVKEYLDYFIHRVFAGLGVSPAIMGYDTTTVGTAEHTQQLLFDKILFCQESIAREVEFFIFNELLWEGGYDPYSNEKDRVKLVFDEVDKSGRIKRHAAAADLYNKNLIDQKQALELAEIKGIPNKNLLYLNQVQIPLAKATEAAKAAARPKTTANLQEAINRILPRDASEVEEFIGLLKNLIEIPDELVSSLNTDLTLLIGDDTAMLNFINAELSLRGLV